MTLTTPYSATFIVGDGETKTFSYLFEEVSPNFISVMVYNSVTGLISTPTYVIDTDQKQVIFGEDTPAPTADETVCIYRNTPNVQDVAFRTLHGYDAQTLENILSKIVAMIQEIKSNYFSTQVLQGDPWQLDLLSSADDGATVNIDYTAKKLVKGLYFRITSGNLQVSGDGVTYITMPKSADIAEFRQQQTELPDHTYQYKLQYRVGSGWFDADSTAQNTADAAYNLAETAQTGLSAHVNNQNNPHQTTVAKLNDVTLTDLQPNQFLKYDGAKWVNVYSSVTATWGGIVGTITDQTDLKDALDAKVNIDGTSIMTAPLKFMAGSMRGAVGPYLNGVGFWKLDSQGNLTQIATLSDSWFGPATTDTVDLGGTGRNPKFWRNLFLSGSLYVGRINNGDPIAIPTYGGTMIVADSTGATAGQILGLDNNLKPGWQNAPTPTVNYSIDGGNYTAGSGTYAITRYSLILQKADFSWEKPTDTSVTYTEATTKTANTNGFILNQIRYYGYTTTLSSGALTAENKVYSKYDGVRMSYSTNCGTAPAWSLGTWIYLVGTLGADGLFYLDTTQWWADALPNSNDGKLYIRLGTVTTSNTSQIAFLEDRPIFYHDGTGIKEYHPGGNGGSVAGQAIDAEIVGTPTISGSDVSGFSDVDYLETPTSFGLSGANSFEISGAFTTGTSVTSDMLKKEKSSGNGNFTISVYNSLLSIYITAPDLTQQSISGITTLSTNTKYYFKLEYDGTNYVLSLSTDGVNYTQEASAVASVLITGNIETYALGKCNPLYPLGALHLNNWCVKKDGIIVWQGMDAPGLGLRVVKGHEVIEFQAPTADNDYTWYRKYVDGWVEQGGFNHSINLSSSGSSNMINLPVTMADTNYTAQATLCNQYGGRQVGIVTTTSTTTQVNVGGYASSSSSSAVNWQVSGMAQG